MKTTQIIKRLNGVKAVLIKNGCSMKEAEQFIERRSNINTLKLSGLEKQARKHKCK